MSFTTFLENEVLDHVFRNATYTPPATAYIGLYTTATNAAGGGTEVSGNGYARKAMAFDASVSGAIDNTAAVEFATATGSWGTITHTAVLDAATAGNMLAETALTASKTVASGDVFRFQAGEFDITLT
tara:strand:- start:2859 stop:3242 length:384 start_codon:yes stop_codon:yes gene_type:complete